MKRNKVTSPAIRTGISTSKHIYDLKYSVRCEFQLISRLVDLFRMNTMKTDWNQPFPTVQSPTAPSEKHSPGSIARQPVHHVSVAVNVNKNFVSNLGISKFSVMLRTICYASVVLVLAAFPLSIESQQVSEVRVQVRERMFTLNFYRFFYQQVPTQNSTWLIWFSANIGAILL